MQFGSFSSNALPSGYKSVGGYGGGAGRLVRGPGGGVMALPKGAQMSSMGGMARPGAQLTEQQFGMSPQATQDAFQAMGAYQTEEAPMDIAALRRKLLQNRQL